MKTILCLALALLAGCSTHGGVQIGSGGVAGSGGSVGLSVQTSSTAAALIGLGFVAGAVYGGTGVEKIPELDPNRTVREQDCTRPIEDPAANLRCR